MPQSDAWSKAGRAILTAARNELYLNLPFLDAALCALPFSMNRIRILSPRMDRPSFSMEAIWPCAMKKAETLCAGPIFTCCYTACCFTGQAAGTRRRTVGPLL